MRSCAGRSGRGSFAHSVIYFKEKLHACCYVLDIAFQYMCSRHGTLNTMFPKTDVQAAVHVGTKCLQQNN